MIIDANMHWLPEDLFTDEDLRDSFIGCVPESEGEYCSLKPMPGTELQQIVIEKPAGYENLNYAENQYDIATQLKDMDEAGVDTRHPADPLLAGMAHSGHVQTGQRPLVRAHQQVSRQVPRPGRGTAVGHRRMPERSRALLSASWASPAYRWRRTTASCIWTSRLSGPTSRNSTSWTSRS